MAPRQWSPRAGFKDEKSDFLCNNTTGTGKTAGTGFKEEPGNVAAGDQQSKVPTQWNLCQRGPEQGDDAGL